MENAIVYQVYNMHGPTVFRGRYSDFTELCVKVKLMSLTGGRYKIVHLPTGEVVASYNNGEEV